MNEAESTRRPTITEQERALVQRWRSLCRVTNERLSAVEQERQRRVGAAATALALAEERVIPEHQRRIAEIEAERERALEAVRARVQAELEQIRPQYESLRGQVLERAEQTEHEIRKEMQEAIWLSDADLEAGQSQARSHYIGQQKPLVKQQGRLGELEKALTQYLARYRFSMRLLAEPDSAPVLQEPAARVIESSNRLCQDVRHEFDRLAGLITPKMTDKAIAAAIVFVASVGAAAGAFFAFGMEGWQAPAIAGGGVLVLSPLVYLAVRWIAARRIASIANPMRERMAQARATTERALELILIERDQTLESIKSRHGAEVSEAMARGRRRQAELESVREAQLKKLDAQYQPKLAAIEREREEELRRLEEEAAARIREETQSHEQAMHAERKRHDEAVRSAEAEAHAQLEQLRGAWNSGVREAEQLLGQVNAESRGVAVPWDQSDWEMWQPPREGRPLAPIGELEVDLQKLEGGIPDAAGFDEPSLLRFSLPVLLEMQGLGSLLVKSGPDGREASLSIVKAAMLRLLTMLPAGKVRFTIFDPIGLGQSFAGFMHLADYEGSFVAEKIWTETRHFEQRLLDLTEHMEHVIQKYLRNEFSSIEAYNERAGEIAEPYRILIYADCPTNLSDTAARRLKSILSTGARCGVHTMIIGDSKPSLPHGLTLEDLERDSVTIEHIDGRFVHRDAAFAGFPFRAAASADEQQLTALLHRIGESATDANRVEVPFEFVAPKDSEIWSASCGSELRVPLGRAGATKLQYLALGRGTAQHALIAGKTGSGKSTLFHVLITNLALWFSPDEVEFYLVDFKKGVEFKVYATHRLPHARVVAIETDREFGLSVLQRVDAELRNRGELFRQEGVQDLAGYRKSTGRPMPRTLVLIDEFQELFVEDDRIAQEAALLLDRLVRQGRAFGIHVVLGSQSLGGAYALPRSTTGQMNVRIALQCTESDSYLIFNEENSAARLLTRPGEGIYNDMGGQIEGNSPFQIVWLPESRREQALKEIGARAQARSDHMDEPTVVFEGNVEARLEENRALERLVERGGASMPTESAMAWLGEPIAIRAPTAAAFSRQSGSHLLILGQRDESSLALVQSAVVSLACHHPDPKSDAAKIFVLDGLSPDSPHAGSFHGLAEVLPNEMHIGDWRHADEIIATVAEACEARLRRGDTESAPIYLVIHGIQRFRSLRRSEDDFSFSMDDDEEKPPSPDKQFATIVREGAGIGVHVIVWCDTSTALDRCVDRQMLRNFDQRVLFQVSVADSTNLIDSPVAAKLGLHRAVFYSEQQGFAEKFRPYGLPDIGWLERLGRRLRGEVLDSKSNESSEQ